MRDSQVNDAAVSSDAGGDAVKSPTKPTSPAAAAAAVAVNETPTSVAAGVLDHQSSENGQQPASFDVDSVTLGSDNVPTSRSGEDMRETVAVKSEGGGVSCVRDLINEAIEKTLQDPVEQSRSLTPSPSIGGLSSLF